MLAPVLDAEIQFCLTRPYLSTLRTPASQYPQSPSLGDFLPRTVKEEPGLAPLTGAPGTQRRLFPRIRPRKRGVSEPFLACTPHWAEPGVGGSTWPRASRHGSRSGQQRLAAPYSPPSSLHCATPFRRLFLERVRAEGGWIQECLWEPGCHTPDDLHPVSGVECGQCPTCVLLMGPRGGAGTFLSCPSARPWGQGPGC